LGSQGGHTGVLVLGELAAYLTRQSLQEQLGVVLSCGTKLLYAGNEFRRMLAADGREFDKLLPLWQTHPASA